MKKIVAFLLMIAMLTPLCMTFLPLLAAADSSVPSPQAEDPVNYAEDVVWNKTVGTPAVKTTKEGAVMTNIHNSWDSAGCNILPALKTALGEEDKVTVTLTVELCGTMAEGKQTTAVSVRPLLRGFGSQSSLGADAWNARYAASLNGDTPLFAMHGNNIMMNFTSGNVTLEHGKWYTYQTVLQLTRNHILCDMLSEWNFCVDTISLPEALESIEFRNLSIVIDDTPLYDQSDDENLPKPQESYTTEIWSPAEIILHSSVVYPNPYVATEIDAVFTHTDGTTVSLPGFWMEGKVWAVRFSPTKVGEWSFTVTCKDPDNKGLNATGKVIATESTKDTELSKRGFVTTVQNQRYYQYADGTPFFWLGDTNWQAFTNVSTTVCNYPGCTCGNQFKHIVDDRVNKGFTVYQTYFVTDAGNGEKSLWRDAVHQQPAIDVFNDKVDSMFEYLHEQGLVVALGLGCHTQTPGQMTLESMHRFARYVVARYACYSIVWISGQEINIEGNSKTPGYSSFDCYTSTSALIEELDGYHHPNSAHMYPVMATDKSAVQLDTSGWHDSWTIQGGHGNINGNNVGHMQSKSFYKSYYDAANAGFAKPFIESESNYEEINCGPYTGYDANRVGAWRAMLCGSAGFTYGVTGIWAGCFSTSTFTGWYGETTSFSYEPWYMGLNKPGSFEMTYMKEFFEDIGCWHELVPRFNDKSYASFLRKEEALIASTEDASVVVGYFYRIARSLRTGTVYKLDDSKVYDAYWFNPRTGKYIVIEKGFHPTDGTYALPEAPSTHDWVFLLTANGLGEHYEESLPTDLNPEYALTAPSGSPITPVGVTAIGGITYSGGNKAAQTMTDHTDWLWDGDPNTIWVPSANRVTQPILFDLGTAQKLTHITITPAEGTVIPTFRVEGSNDGIHWNIIVDNSEREGKYPGEGSEPLTGVYRYVKVLLLNAKDVSGSVAYETIFNPMNNATYSVTKIRDIVLYGDGEGTPTPEVLVADTLGNPPEAGDSSSDTDEANTNDNQADTSELPDTGNATTNPIQGNKGCSSRLGLGTVCLLVAASGCLLKKRKDSLD